MQRESCCQLCQQLIISQYDHMLVCSKYQRKILEQVKLIINTGNQTQINFLGNELAAAFELFDKLKKQKQIKQNYLICSICQDLFDIKYGLDKVFQYEQCGHIVCNACNIQHARTSYIQYGQIRCPSIGCKTIVQEFFNELILGEGFIQSRILANEQIVKCCRCQQSYSFQQGKINDVPKSINGKILTQSQIKAYASDRFVCPQPACKTEQCRKCNTTPFHAGYTCQQFKLNTLKKKCKYCFSQITEKNKLNSDYPVHSQICNSNQCKQLARNSCKKMLLCGHACYGVHNEVACLPCLHPDCASKIQSLNGEDADSYCKICYTQALGAAPCVQSYCGHIFHQHCLAKRLQVKWLSPRIIFGFCLCPLCKKRISVAKENRLSAILQQMNLLQANIRQMALKRAQIQNLHNDQKVTNPTSSYYNKSLEYAMAIYAYFMCFKCKSPYFAGRKICADAMQPQNQDNKFDPSQLVCFKCSDFKADTCKDHGKQYIQYKCKFCCQIAQWFCWGNTHFCESCHTRQVKGDYVNQYSKDKLPICKGPGACPSGGKHGANGEQLSIGCALCPRNIDY